MKIKHVTVDVLEVPVDRAYVAGGNAVGVNSHSLVRVETEDGTVGFGYIVIGRGELMRAIAEAAREIGQTLVGRNVLDVEAAWQAMAAKTKWCGPGGMVYWAMAAIDIAMWDAAGKVLGQPLWRLLGGYRDHLPTYASDGLWYSLSLDELTESASRHAAAGHNALKLRLGRDFTPVQQVARAKAAQAGAGAGVDVMVDATESWDFPYAQLAGPALEEAGVTWLEDPVNHEDLAGLATLANMLRIPVTGCENLYTLGQFRETLAARAVDVAILDLFRVGGITPWRKIAGMAEAHRIPICGHVVPEVHVHLLAAVPNGMKVEYMPRSTAILENMPVPKDGVLHCPTGPGHGLVLDEKAVARYRVG